MMDTALRDLAETIYRRTGGRSVPEFELRSILAILVRSAHLEDARAVCDWCAREKHMPPASKFPNGWWHYTPGQISRKCDAGPIWDALSLLPGGRP